MSQWWYCSAALWFVALVVATPATFTLWFRPKHARFGDPMRAGVWLVSAVFVLHPLRFLYAFDSANLFKALYALGMLAAFQTIRLMRIYGRGQRITDA